MKWMWGIVAACLCGVTIDLGFAQDSEGRPPDCKAGTAAKIRGVIEKKTGS